MAMTKTTSFVPIVVQAEQKQTNLLLLPMTESQLHTGQAPGVAHANRNLILLRMMICHLHTV